MLVTGKHGAHYADLDRRGRTWCASAGSAVSRSVWAFRSVCFTLRQNRIHDAKTRCSPQLMNVQLTLIPTESP